MTDTRKRYAMVCNICGSDEVSRDAWANWDTNAQDWVLGAVFDDAHCHKCGGETSIIEVALAPAST